MYLYSQFNSSPEKKHSSPKLQTFTSQILQWWGPRHPALSALLCLETAVSATSYVTAKSRLLVSLCDPIWSFLFSLWTRCFPIYVQVSAIHLRMGKHQDFLFLLFFNLELNNTQNRLHQSQSCLIFLKGKDGSLKFKFWFCLLQLYYLFFKWVLLFLLDLLLYVAMTSWPNVLGTAALRVFRLLKLCIILITLGRNLSSSCAHWDVVDHSAKNWT